MRHFATVKTVAKSPKLPWSNNVPTVQRTVPNGGVPFIFSHSNYNRRNIHVPTPKIVAKLELATLISVVNIFAYFRQVFLHKVSQCY